jgi:hypothetical protein
VTLSHVNLFPSEFHTTHHLVHNAHLVSPHHHHHQRPPPARTVTFRPQQPQHAPTTQEEHPNTTPLNERALARCHLANSDVATRRQTTNHSSSFSQVCYPPLPCHYSNKIQVPRCHRRHGNHPTNDDGMVAFVFANPGEPPPFVCLLTTKPRCHVVAIGDVATKCVHAPHQNACPPTRL